MFLGEKRKGKILYQEAPGGVVAFARELALRVGYEGGARHGYSFSARIHTYSNATGVFRTGSQRTSVRRSRRQEAFGRSQV